MFLGPIEKFNENWQDAWSQYSRPSLCFFVPIEKKKIFSLPYDWLRHFRRLTETADYKSTKLNRKEDLNVLFEVCVFRAYKKRQKEQIPWSGVWLAETLLTSSLKLLNELQQNRKQDDNVLYQVCVFRTDRIEHDSRHHLWFVEKFSTSLKPLNRTQRTLQEGISQRPLPI